VFAEELVIGFTRAASAVALDFVGRPSLPSLKLIVFQVSWIHPRIGH